MKKITPLFNWIPEFYFILVSVLWFYSSLNGKSPDSVNMINFPAIILIVLFHIQLFLRDHVMGKFLVYLCSVASVYILVQFLISGNILSNFNYQSQVSMLKIGNIFILNFIMAALMYKNYKRSGEMNEEQAVRV